ncbi:Leucyl-tRNA synthetase [[Mycoplasma] cavipharyngis]|uniref:class I tRNA ligase family protein n=1 Tax=[Mycoplasma] cavipharyngis TaxID=92757 RepID=UPI003703AEA2
MIYNHNLIEAKWRKYWDQNQTYRFVDQLNNPKYYALDMFPYPSGAGLHVGHLKGYLATEILSRYKKALGFNVLHPIGWDAFGLPAEQFALKTGNHPASFTLKNIDHFRKQLQMVGFAFDYQKEVCTIDPKYYKTTQWIFLKLFEHGLAEIQEINVNWCPELKIVLANEEVIIKNGQRVSERGEHPVIFKPMKQWVLKITQYADKLLETLDDLDWPEGIKEHQKNWIGRKEKYTFNFVFNDKTFVIHLEYASNFNQLEGILINQSSWIAQDLLTNNEIKSLIDAYLTDQTIQTPLLLPITVKSIDFQKELPVFLSKKLDDKNPEILPYFLDLENKIVDQSLEQLFLEKNLNQKCHKVVTYKLRDWIFSRQRYWGEPIPIYFDANNQAYPDYNLPVILPELEKIEPSNDGRSPLIHATEWLNFKHNNQNYYRETNTMPNWAGSCWYYLGYILKNVVSNDYLDINSDQAFQLMQRWLPVDVYVGGQEHAVLHLLYARFWHRFLYDLKIVPTKEPFQKLVNQGMILGPDGQKMSKSKGNVIAPDEIIDSHGADALRLYECFMGPVYHSMPWSESGLNAIRKWVDRVYSTFTINLSQWTQVNDDDQQMLRLEAQLLKNFELCAERLNFNVGVSEMMIFINYLHDHKIYSSLALKSFVQVLSLYAPFLAEELWQVVLKQPQSVYLASWPKYDPQILVDDQIELAVTINNKFVTTINVINNASIDLVKQKVFSDPKIQAKIKQKSLVKEVYVPNKIFNLTIK